MATIDDVLTFARVQALTDSNGLTDDNGIIFANEALADFHRQLVDSGVDASQVRESYTSGTANQGTYLYPMDLMLLKAIEVNFTDTNPQNYLVAQQIDASNTPANVSFSWLRANQPMNYPLFDDRGDWFEIFPTPTAAFNLVNMFRILYFYKPTEFTSTSDVIDYPESLDYRILGWRVVADFFKSLNTWDAAANADNEYQNRVIQVIKTLSRGVQTPMIATPIQATGWEF